MARNLEDGKALGTALASGGNVDDLTAKAHALFAKGGGTAGALGQLEAIAAGLPANLKQDDRFAGLEKDLGELRKRNLEGAGPPDRENMILSLLNQRLQSEVQKGTVSADRRQTLGGLLGELRRVVSAEPTTAQTLKEQTKVLVEQTAQMRELMKNSLDLSHYLSHPGLTRPAPGSRAAALVELNWKIRRYLLEEMMRSDKGEQESKVALDLSERATRVDARIYECGEDDRRAAVLESEELRPLALTVREFSGRFTTTIGRPIWSSAPVPTDTNAVFFAGAVNNRSALTTPCLQRLLYLLPEPRGVAYAAERWRQLQTAMTAVFDFRTQLPRDAATVAYELGMALTLGRPIVVLISENQLLPFDVDIEPVVVSEQASAAAIAEAIDETVFSTLARPTSDGSAITVTRVLSHYPRPQKDTYVDQTIGMLSALVAAPDPTAATQTLTQLIRFLNDGALVLMHPRWARLFPEPGQRRLFHVMPFRPAWAPGVTQATREACRAMGVEYIRGDELSEPDVIRSIFAEISRATHILVDLTDTNQNVALELGIAHTLGKHVLMVCQGDPKEHVFTSISHLRLQSYDPARLSETLGTPLRTFIQSTREDAFA